MLGATQTLNTFSIFEILLDFLVFKKVFLLLNLDPLLTRASLDLLRLISTQHACVIEKQKLLEAAIIKIIFHRKKNFENFF